MRVNVHALGVQGHCRFLDPLLIDGDEHEVDVRLRPHRIVRQAAAQNGRENGAVSLELLDSVSSAAVNFC